MEHQMNGCEIIGIILLLGLLIGVLLDHFTRKQRGLPPPDKSTIVDNRRYGHWSDAGPGRVRNP